jgi:peptidylprolyl isomerase
MFRKLGKIALCAGVLAMANTMGAAMAAELENTLYLETKNGRVVIEMRPDLAPNHVARIKELAREKFYDGLASQRRWYWRVWQEPTA